MCQLEKKSIFTLFVLSVKTLYNLHQRFLYAIRIVTEMLLHRIPLCLENYIFMYMKQTSGDKIR